MNISRSYFILATLFLLCGICLGMYMGGSGDHELQPVHAHLNLLGFTLLMVFGLVFRIVPAMGGSVLARIQLWLHGLGTLWLMALLTLNLLGYIADAAMALAVLGELAVLAGVVLFLVNLLRNGRAAETGALRGAVPAE